MEPNPSRTVLSFGHLTEWPWTSPWTCFIIFFVKYAPHSNFQDDSCSIHSYQSSLRPHKHSLTHLVWKGPFAQKSCVPGAAAAKGLCGVPASGTLRHWDTWPLFVVLKGVEDGGLSVGILVWEKQLLSLTPFSSPYNSRFFNCASTRAPQMFASFNSI